MILDHFTLLDRAVFVALMVGVGYLLVTSYLDARRWR